MKTIKVGGHAVLHGSPRWADVSKFRDYFTSSTYYGLDISTKAVIRFNHNLDPVYPRWRMGMAAIGPPTEKGLPVEGEIAVRDEFDEVIVDWIGAGLVGFSTGSVAHVIRREEAPGGTHEVVHWPLNFDITLTRTPADPRQIGQVKILGPGTSSPGKAAAAMKVYSLRELTGHGDDPSAAPDDCEHKVAAKSSGLAPGVPASRWGAAWDRVADEYLKKPAVREFRGRWSRHVLAAARLDYVVSEYERAHGPTPVGSGR